MKYVGELTDTEKIREIKNTVKKITYSTAQRYIGIDDLHPWLIDTGYLVRSGSNARKADHIRYDPRVSYYKEPHYGANTVYILISKTMHVFKK